MANKQLNVNFNQSFLKVMLKQIKFMLKEIGIPRIGNVPLHLTGVI